MKKTFTNLKHSWWGRYLRENWLIIIPSILIVIATIVAGCLGAFASAANWIVPLATTIVTAVFGLLKTKINDDESRVASLLLDYTRGVDGVTFDDVLGVLISNKAHKNYPNPSSKLFESVIKQCTGSFEDRRRIAEALPGLFRVNSRETKTIVRKKLRVDFHGRRWKDDIRRRTIESFSYLLRKRHFSFKKHFIKSMLVPINNDSVYTLIAILEIICFENLFLRQKKREKFLGRLKEAMFPLTATAQYPQGFSQEDFDLVDEVYSFSMKLRKAKSDITKKANLFMTTFPSCSDNMKIVIAKNLTRIYKNNFRCFENDECAEKPCMTYIIRLFDMCFAKASPKNVRRPMAHENICFCLIYLLSTGYKDEAERCFMRLIEDDDWIIPMTAFDYIHKLLEIEGGAGENSLCRRIIQYCTNIESASVFSEYLQEEDQLTEPQKKKKEDWLKLRDRAEHIKNVLKISI